MYLKTVCFLQYFSTVIPIIHHCTLSSGYISIWCGTKISWKLWRRHLNQQIPLDVCGCWLAMPLVAGFLCWLLACLKLENPPTTSVYRFCGWGVVIIVFVILFVGFFVGCAQFKTSISNSVPGIWKLHIKGDQLVTKLELSSSLHFRK